jgi:hypothetical protein
VEEGEEETVNTCDFYRSVRSPALKSATIAACGSGFSRTGPG